MRREKELIVNDRGRELRFKIVEMSAIELDSWLTRMSLLRGKAGLSENFFPKGGEAETDPVSMAMGAVDFEQIWPLMNEMLACCRRVDAGIEQICTPESVGGFIEDVRTLNILRTEALQLNLDFSEPEPESSSGSPERIHIGKPQLKAASLSR